MPQETDDAPIAPSEADAAFVRLIERRAPANAEEERLNDARTKSAHWKRWGPYISERAWGTVREDYSPDGAAWGYFPFDHAQSRAFRWNEDGLGGICDKHQHICFGLALWNEQDPILKERLFGLGGPEGNHGEDVKELYYYLDSTPTHSYMKFLYKYPQARFPYEWLRDENRKRGRGGWEFEIQHAGVFEQNRYFDVFIEYAKSTPEDICIKITATNRGDQLAPLHILPTIWFRNTWGWGGEVMEVSERRGGGKPHIAQKSAGKAYCELHDAYYGNRYLGAEEETEFLFCNNDTNLKKLFGATNRTAYPKDGINDYIVNGRRETVNPEKTGTKAAAHFSRIIQPGESVTVRLRFTDKESKANDFDDFEAILEARKAEADIFYNNIIPTELSADARNVFRQSMAGMFWSKQFYHYVVRTWLSGDPLPPSPPDSRKQGRNSDWGHLFNSDVISMPDKWEYPWYAAWDLAFHALPIALADPDFAKEQLMLMVREWYMHPNGQLPAYEWAFGDVNPPVHAWAALRVYKIEKNRNGGVRDVAFLEKIFHKLLLNFTWWVNRKDVEGNNVFQGGFLGLDNIGVFDRSAPLPTGGHLEQSDGTSWMAMYTLNLLAIAFELCKFDSAYEDVASKFWEHFIYIATAMNGNEGGTLSLWDEEDGFYYDVLHLPDGSRHRLKVRSLVGLIPLFAVETLEPDRLDGTPGFKRRLQWFLDNRPDLTANVAAMNVPGRGARRLLSIVNADQLRRILSKMLDEEEFLSPFGIRSLSKWHEKNPYILYAGGNEYRVNYEPSESQTGLFGGNSNWRGPVWFPTNYLLIESLQRFHYYYGDSFKVECPTGSGNYMNLWDVAAEISRRLTHLFLRDENGKRACFGGDEKMSKDPNFADLLLFHEYFHGDNGAGLGASHQTGWTGLVAKLLQQTGE